MTWLQNGIYVVAVSAGLAYAWRRGMPGLVEVYAFFVPWFGLQANPGVTINADRFVALILTFILVARGGLTALVGFVGFLAFILANTVAQSLDLPASAASYPALQGEWRWLLQLVMWTILVTPAAALAWTRSAAVTRRVLRVLVLSCTSLAVLAIVQWTVHFATGVDIFPIDVFSAGAGEGVSAAFVMDRVGTVFRACALGGEPKHLAYSLVVSLTVITSDMVFGAVLGLSGRRRSAAAALQLVALVLTFSTQGLFLFAGNVVILLVVAAALRGVSRRQVSFVAVAVAAGATVLIIPELADILRTRTVDRLIETRGLEDWNIAVWDWLTDNLWALPLGVGLGNVHLYAAPYIPTEYRYYMAGNVFVAKSGFLRILSEAGIVGLLFFAYTIYRPLRSLWWNARSRRSDLAAPVFYLVLTVTIDYLLSLDGPTYVFLFIGAGLAVMRALRDSSSSPLTIPATVTVVPAVRPMKMKGLSG